VVGAQAIFGGPGKAVGSDQPDHPTGTGKVTISATASEDASYTATLYQVVDEDGDGEQKAASETGVVKAYFTPAITINPGSLQDGFYQVVLRLTAVATTGTPNARSSIFRSKVFKVGNATSNVTVISSLSLTGNLNGVFTSPPGGFTINLGSTSTFQVLTNVSNQLGTPHLSGFVNLGFLATVLIPYRATQSAHAKLPVYKIRMTKGKKLVFPRIKKLPAGHYKMRFAIAAGRAHAVLTTPAFAVDAKGKLSFGKTKPVKPKPKKPKKKQ
jgi:hypothetical protein